MLRVVVRKIATRATGTAVGRGRDRRATTATARGRAVAATSRARRAGDGRIEGAFSRALQDREPVGQIARAGIAALGL